MSRLIDADATKRRVADTYFDTLIPCVNRALDDSPTVDAIPVVRCENCKYGYPCGDEIVCYHPEYELAEGKWSYKKDFFCAFGDTKEGADNG